VLPVVEVRALVKVLAAIEVLVDVVSVSVIIGVVVIVDNKFVGVLTTFCTGTSGAVVVDFI
jgi:hypothetical protein